ncbi:MAG TPA: right-handed parallel beta-helix repeat-containing protein, partial [Bacteroidales bacterium]|nr:right-handed parallel beta-helix repeat-containing protein [Bacteroidales bacterium]
MMKKLILISMLAWMLGNTLIAQTFIGGVIYQDLLLSREDSPYIVTENLIIADTVILTIEPGVDILFEEGIGFRSLGAIVAEGSENAPITFKARTGSAEFWSGITLLQQSQTDTIADVFRHCDFSGVTSTVLVAYRRNDLIVESSEFHDNPNFTIKLFDNNNTQIRNNDIRNGGYGIYVSSNNISQNLLIENNRIENLYSVGIIIFGQDGLTADNLFRNNTISNCLYGIQVRGGEKTFNNVFDNNVIFNNEVGILVFNGYNTLSGNVIFNNESGINLIGNDVAGGKNNEIRKNLLFDNEQGVLLEELSTGNIIDSNLVFRNNIGMNFFQHTVEDGVSNTVTNNTFYQNDSATFLLKDSPQDSIAYNNFNDGIQPYFFLFSEADQVATYNWWGTSDALLIDKNIFDVNDSIELGEVIYEPFLTEPAASPIAPPINPVKQLVGDTLVVRWQKANSSEVAGYKVYYGAKNAYQYEEEFELGDTNILKLPDYDITEKVSVTSYKSAADGLNDQQEFNESWFVTAEMYPFAGRNYLGCEGRVIEFSNATAYEYDSLQWFTSGQGTLLNANNVVASYLHADEDLNDTIWFWLNQYDSTLIKKDSVPVYFSSLPEVFAGKDTSIVIDSAFRIENAKAAFVDSLQWTTLGDGSFSFPDSLSTVYFPGLNDKETGEVNLILSGSANCGQHLDTLNLKIMPSYSLEGSVNYEGLPEGLVTVLTDDAGYFRNVAQQQPGLGKEFSFSGVPLSSGYLLYLPEFESDYLPTYYVNKLRWEEAYKLQVNANTYDLDIQPQKPAYQLPAGQGEIKGQVQLNGNRNSGMPVIHLTDTATNVLKWATPGEGSVFDFKQLPFGSYRLGVESVGIPYFITQPFTLSPDNPTIENLSIVIDDKQSYVEIPIQK